MQLGNRRLVIHEYLLALHGDLLEHASKTECSRPLLLLLRLLLLLLLLCAFSFHPSLLFLSSASSHPSSPRSPLLLIVSSFSSSFSSFPPFIVYSVSGYLLSRPSFLLPAASRLFSKASKSKYPSSFPLPTGSSAFLRTSCCQPLPLKHYNRPRRATRIQSEQCLF